MWKRLPRVIIWLTASVILLEVAFPSTVLLWWMRDGWSKVNSTTVAELARDERCPWANSIGKRKAIVGLVQWEQDTVDFKEWPDFQRMVLEISLTVLIGIGLAYAIRGPEGDRAIPSPVESPAVGKDSPSEPPVLGATQNPTAIP
jgi:hypothetical protein